MIVNSSPNASSHEGDGTAPLFVGGASDVRLDSGRPRSLRFRLGTKPSRSPVLSSGRCWSNEWKRRLRRGSEAGAHDYEDKNRPVWVLPTFAESSLA